MKIRYINGRIVDRVSSIECRVVLQCYSCTVHVSYHIDITDPGVWSLESGHVVTGSKFKLIGDM